MLIRNIKFDSNKHYKCVKQISKYLTEKGFSPISFDGDLLVFKKSKELKTALKIMPIHLKLVDKVSSFYEK